MVNRRGVGDGGRSEETEGSDDDGSGGEARFSGYYGGQGLAGSTRSSVTHVMAKDVQDRLRKPLPEARAGEGRGRRCDPGCH